MIAGRESQPSPLPYQGVGSFPLLLLLLLFLPLFFSFCGLTNAATVPPGAGPRSPFELYWERDPSGPTRAWVSVKGIPEKLLLRIFSAEFPATSRDKLFTVSLVSDSPALDIDLPSMIGDLENHDGHLRFTPRFPLERGRKYLATFRPALLPTDPGTISRQATPLTKHFEIPRQLYAPSTTVSAIYPGSNELPENLLKFYVHFSAPMSQGHIYDHIHLRASDGRLVELPFLEIDEELWNPELTRLTLFIDPGRIKRGVLPLEEIGPSLQQDKSYTLEIDSSWLDATGTPLKYRFIKHFKVTPPDREPLTTANWTLTKPRSGTRDPLIVDFPKPMDHALALRCLQVRTGQGSGLPGSVTLSEQEKRWTFVPEADWPKGSHEISVLNTLEDLAGNNIGKAFEVDVVETVQRRILEKRTTIPFSLP